MGKVDGREIAAIFGGGFVGAIARVVLSEIRPADASWPWATFSINIVGSFLLGYFATRLQERLPVSAYRRPLVATGFCGAFTTFSTLQLELVRMFDAHHYVLSAAYLAGTLGGGFMAVWFASAVVRRVSITG